MKDWGIGGSRDLGIEEFRNWRRGVTTAVVEQARRLRHETSTKQKNPDGAESKSLSGSGSKSILAILNFVSLSASAPPEPTYVLLSL